MASSTMNRWLRPEVYPLFAAMGLLWGSADSSWFATSASTLMSGLSPSPFRSVLGRVLCMFACNQRLLCDSDWLHHFF
ncbi:hypothetical protein CK203_006731 [Vitis vinifera]|uniref:Uncharacterized protein n=1 Tax=Vitis vinifera TaxID=29760 RepID=A0A438KBM3_VITVI|nr:hypothetical protein CK203_006731 [Vitis vinifera]